MGASALLLAPLLVLWPATTAGATNLVTLSGTLDYADGAPATGWQVGVFDGTALPTGTAMVGADGSYSLRVDADTAELLWVLDPSYAPPALPASVLSAPITLTGDRTLDLTFPSVDVHVHVVNTDGRPVAGATVTGYPVGSPFVSSVTTADLYPGATTGGYLSGPTATTDAAGEALVRTLHVDGSTTTIDVSAGSYYPAAVPGVSLSADSTVPVTLSPTNRPGTATIEGTVTDSGGNSLDMRVRLYDDHTGKPVTDHHPNAVYVGPSGTYVFSGVPSGSYHVRFGPEAPPIEGGPFVIQWNGDAASMATSPAIVISDGDSTVHEADAVMEVGGEITGAVTDHDGSPLGGATTVRAYDDATGLATKVRTDNVGNYQLADLAPGSYHLHFGDGIFVPSVWYGDTPDRASSTAVTVTADIDTVANAHLGAAPVTAGETAPRPRRRWWAVSGRTAGGQGCWKPVGRVSQVVVPDFTCHNLAA